MSDKVLIDTSTPYGYLVAEAIQKMREANTAMDRAKEAKALDLANGGTLDGSPSFGGATGQSGDYSFAVDVVADAFAAFMTTNAGPISQLDQGDVY